MTNFEWLKTLTEEEFVDWLYNDWLDRLQYLWSSSRGGLIIWLKDRKTENSSEKPNNSTCSKMEQVDEPKTDCNGCKFVGTYDTEFPCANCSRKTKDYYAKTEPQTERRK